MVSNTVGSDGHPQRRPPKSSSDGRGGEVVRLAQTLSSNPHTNDIECIQAETLDTSGPRYSCVHPL